MTVRTAGIVGLNWGLVHLRTLRAVGCEVVAVASTDAERARAVAAEQGVPLGTDDVSVLNDLDVVVVATPAASHPAVLRALPEPFVICEKPLVGLGGSAQELPPVGERMFVNYAFSFLQTARTMTDLVAEVGAPSSVAVQVGVNLPLEFSLEQWFLEAASHPTSWLLHLLGEPVEATSEASSDGLVVRARAGSTLMQVTLSLGGPAGIHQRGWLEWPERLVEFSGRYVPGSPWRYDPVLLNGSGVNGGEFSESDCWLDANEASVRTMIEVFRGQRSATDGLAIGLFDAKKALWLESLMA